MTLVPFRCAFFHGEVDKPAQGFLHRGGRKPVTVAISLEGVHVIDSKEKVPPQSALRMGLNCPWWGERSRCLVRVFVAHLGPGV